MRSPLKYQIMLPLSGVMLVTVLLISLANAWLAGSRARQQIESQLSGIGDTLLQSTFPLTDAVLAQVRGLSGAEFAVTDEHGKIVATSGRLSRGEALDESPVSSDLAHLSLRHRRPLNGETHFHVAVDLRRPTDRLRPATLHMFYPEVRYRQAWSEAVVPPLLFGTVALVVVALSSGLIAARVTRPVRRLCDQVSRVAFGQYAPFPVPDRDDELRDLSLAVNRMAETLSIHEEDVRRHERLKTLDQLAGGIAHQLRNNVTGCRMAVDLHRRGCPKSQDESLGVAVQQLELMEEYLRRFLALGRSSDLPFRPVDVRQVIEQVLPLVRPNAQHLHVALDWQCPAEPQYILGDADALAQVVVNLLINAVEAASTQHVARSGVASPPWVALRLSHVNQDKIRLEVRDSGSGPNEEVRERIFEPLVSGKRDGAGLGLAIAREIIERHQGRIDWQRVDEQTCFSIDFPATTQETADVHATCG